MSLAIVKDKNGLQSEDDHNDDTIVIIDDDDDDSDVEIEQISNSIAKENELFFKNFLSKLPLDTEVIVCKSNAPIRIGTSALNYSNLPETQIIIVNNALISSTECIPKRYLYVNKFDSSAILPIRTRMYHHSSSQFGFILEQPCSTKNRNRYLILYDNHTAAYHSTVDFHLCLCQEYSKHLLNIEYADLRIYYQQIYDNLGRFSLPNWYIGQIIRVKKFGSQYHNARIIDKDDSIIKVCFFERKSQTELWIYSNSSIIQSYQDIQLTRDDLTRLRKRKTHVNETLNQKKLRDRSNTKLSITNDQILPSSRANILNGFYIDVLQPKFLLLNSLPYEPHKCSSECVRQSEESLRLDRILINPFLIPFECQWSIVDGKPRGYRTPCHRTFYSLDEIERYLYRTESKLSIKFFLDDLLTRFTPSINQSDRNALVLNDLSNGLETIRVPVYNDLSNDRPEQFTYVTDIQPFDQDIAQAYNDRSLTTCCNCIDNCSDRMKCACYRKTLHQALINHDPFVSEKQKNRHSLTHIIKTLAYQKKRLLHPVSSGIYECNSRCSCHVNHCSNRLIQQGIYVQLQLFKDKHKGWGLRALHDIPRGTFICQYLGELITSDQGHDRAQTMDDKYQTSLDLIRQIRYENQTIDDDEEPFVIDGSLFSNLGKYFNHSCDPNMYIQNVFIESHDLHFPNLALFTLNRVKAGEELTWHYNCELLPDRQVICYCGAKNCRGRLF